MPELSLMRKTVSVKTVSVKRYNESSRRRLVDYGDVEGRNVNLTFVTIPSVAHSSGHGISGGKHDHEMLMGHAASLTKKPSVVDEFYRS